MKQRLMITIVFAIIALAAAIILFEQYNAQLQAETEPSPSPTASASPTASPSPTPTASPTPAPQENVNIQSVSIDNKHQVSMYASAQSGQDITIVKIVLTDNEGNVLATDDSVSKILPANGTLTQLTINSTDDLIIDAYTLTIFTANGNSFAKTTAPSYVFR